MAQARAFQQGLNRAVKAEDKFNRSYAMSDAMNRQRGNRRGGKGANAHDEKYQALKPSIERKGEIKYHAANEKKMREKAAVDFDEDGWGWIGEDDGKAVVQNDGATRADEQNVKTTNQNDNSTNQEPHTGRYSSYVPPHKRGVVNEHLREPKKNVKGETEEDAIGLEDKPKETPLPPQHLMARMKILDAYDDDGDGGEPLI